MSKVNDLAKRINNLEEVQAEDEVIDKLDDQLNDAIWDELDGITIECTVRINLSSLESIDWIHDALLEHPNKSIKEIIQEDVEYNDIYDYFEDCDYEVTDYHFEE